jgi:hypothetical protein
MHLAATAGKGDLLVDARAPGRVESGGVVRDTVSVRVDRYRLTVDVRDV